MEAGPISETAEVCNCELQVYQPHLPEKYFASYKIIQAKIHS
jgi:hypothetical protein